MVRSYTLQRHFTSLQSFSFFSFAHLAIGQSQGVLLGLGGSVLTGLDSAGQQQTARERLPHNQSVGAAAAAAGAGSSRPDKRVAAEAKVCRSGLDDVRACADPTDDTLGHSEQ